MSRKYKISLNIDDRTDGMTSEALVCRTWGHKWEVKAIGRKRTLDLLERGLYERSRYCGNGCGCTWRQVFDIASGSVVENDRQYPKNGEYLAPKSRGRIRRADAFPAFFARENPEYV